jgi:hypothetical protein
VGDDDASELGGHVLEVVAYGLDDDNRSPILAIGEVKWGEVMGLGHLERLARIQALLVAQERYGAADARLVCYSATGFTDDLRDRAATDTGVVLLGAGGRRFKSCRPDQHSCRS